MKVAVAFLGKNKTDKKITDIFENLILNMSIGVYFFSISIVLYILMVHTNIYQVILHYSTNFRQTETKNYSFDQFVGSYGIFAKNNYILTEKEKIEDQVIEATTLENMSEYEVIDLVAKEYENQMVFSNIPDAVITSENATLQRISIGTTSLLNYSSRRNINFSDLLSSNVYLAKKSDRILLYNTHTSETYTNSEKYQFEYTGVMRTTDANYNMLSIAKELNSNLNSKGFISTHNTTPHDYGTYTSAYAKSRMTVEEALKNMGGAAISIDVHRDAIADLTYRPTADVKGIQVAQLMFVMGIGSDDYPNENWADNLRLAITLQMLADKVYPGLFKPMIIRDSVYNQDLNKYSLLVEVGATGNTIEEAKLATRCLTNLLNILYKD